MTQNVAILIFDEVEVLDFAGPFEVFGVAGSTLPDKPFNVFTIAEKAEPVIARNGLSIKPNYTLATAPKIDILLVPGGRGTRRELNNLALLDWIKTQSSSVDLLLSVCTGALLLGKAGLLEGLSATTYWNAMDELRAVAPNTIVKTDERYVDNGRVVLSAGVSAGIDMSLHIVARLHGTDAALFTARGMEYDYWKP